MLKKDNRLLRQKDFDRLFSGKGAFFSQDFLAVKVAPNGLPVTRIGFIVSNKISKRATARNRMKRLLREAVRLRWKEVRPGADAAIMVRADISDKKLADVDKVVDSLLKKSGLIVSK